MYNDALIAYLDILGLTASIKSSLGDSQQINSIYKVLDVWNLVARYMNANARREGKLQLKCTAFSDTLIISTQQTDDDAFRMVARLIAAIQCSLPRHGFFCRGALVRGKYFQKGNIMFGPAYINAYEQEKQAIWPRVLIDRTVLNELNDDELKQGDCQYMLRDDSGLTYLNYLQLAFNMKFLVDVKTLTLQEMRFPLDTSILHEHKIGLLSCVKKAISMDDQDWTVLAKFHALANYHNKVIDRLCRTYSLSPRTKKDDLKTVAQKVMAHARKISAEESDVQKLKAIKVAKVLISQQLKKYREERVDLASTFPPLYLSGH